MMNPSCASAEISDLTVDRVMHFSREHGCSDAIVVNPWPLITPVSKVLWTSIRDIPGAALRRNRCAIKRASTEADVRIVAFGLNEGRKHRLHTSEMSTVFGDDPMCLGPSSDGWPYHPWVRGKLFIPNDRRLQPWTAPANTASA